MINSDIFLQAEKDLYNKYGKRKIDLHALLNVRYNISNTGGEFEQCLELITP